MLQNVGRRMYMSRVSLTLAGRSLSSSTNSSPWPWPLPNAPKNVDVRDQEMNGEGHRCYGSSNYEQLNSNWAESCKLDHARMVAPAAVDEVQEIIRDCDQLSIVGSGHSFNDASRTTGGTMISTAYLNVISEIDVETMTVTCGAGTTMGELCRYLHARGCALYNTASFPQLTVAGAISTGTHGTGVKYPGVAGNVAALEIVTGDGTLKKLARGEEDFKAAAVSLGALGVITSLTFDILPEYTINQRVYGGINIETVSFSETLRSADNVGALINFGAGVIELLHVRDRVDVDYDTSHTSDDNDDNNSTTGITDSDTTTRTRTSTTTREAYEQEHYGDLITEPVVAWESHQQLLTTSTGAWHQHLHHFMDGSFRDVPLPVLSFQTEFFVDLDVVDDAIRAVANVAKHWPGWSTWDNVAPHTQGLAHICEVRTTAADDLWLSPSFARDTASIHFTLAAYPNAAYAVVRELEDALRPFDARAHWGKLWTESSINKYPKADLFKELRNEFDPNDKFKTDFVVRSLGL
eukprot:m.111813 g.111813  ORF g.111813 m.111813 type:complete len:522 (+) comp28146_c0_seq1:33-1598(+)